MKQNKYDDNDFFESYGKLPRSINGLDSAGEWNALRKMFPDFQGKKVLDLGCGYGWHCIHAKQQGAKKVVGIDLSQKMILKAEEYSKDLAIDYRQIAIEDIDFEPKEFDIVISSLAFHYLKDLEKVFGKISHILKNRGSFVFSMEHPVFTAKAEQNWYLDENSNRLHWPVDNYQDESKRKTQFLGHAVIKYHRTLETILNTGIQSDFEIQEISEPQPSDEILKKYPEMKDEMRRPMFIIISAIKK